MWVYLLKRLLLMLPMLLGITLVSFKEQTEFIQQIDFWIVQAYTTGLSRAMLVLAAVCFTSAGVVYVGLRTSKNYEELEA